MFANLISQINSFFWDYLLLILLSATGIYFTFRLRFVQVRKWAAGMKAMFGGVFASKKGTSGGGISSFQSLATAVAAQIGTGNIAGAATAIAAGGPGAIFWMWVSSFFGMATIFAEATLAQEYKVTRHQQNEGGPVYYILAAFRGKFGRFLAGFFAVAIILALGFMGNMVQSNSLADAFQTAFGIQPIVPGIAVAVLCCFVFVGGIGRIAKVAEKLVPLMAGLYIVGSLVVIGVNYRSIGTAFTQIFTMAFDANAVIGGVTGVAVQKALRIGVSRGLFSNEAGMGSTPHAHAAANVKHPCEQGVAAMAGVFLDTFMMLTLTALVILTSGALQTGATGAALAQAAYDSVFGDFGRIFIAVSMFFFAFSSIIGWYFFGEINVKYLFGKKAVKGYALLVVFFLSLGSVLQVDLVWSLSDLFNGLMVLPNLFALLALSSVVVRLCRQYDRADIRLNQKK